MSNNDFLRSKSLITAIKTPYKLDGSIDLESFDVLIKRQIMHQVEGVVVGGTTGEGHLMDWPEHLFLIEHCVKHYSKDLLIIGNTGSNNTKESLYATGQGFKAGMHAALLINPYYGKTSNSGLVEHFWRAMDLGPSIIYNVPLRTAQDISEPVVEKLATHPHFVAVKECMGNERIASYYKKGIYCWSGNDEQSFHAKHNANALGLISVAANVVPSWMRKLMDVNDENLNQKMQPIFQWMSSEPNPIPLNSLLADMRLTKPVFRLPYCPLPYTQREKGLKLIEPFLPTELQENCQPLPDDDFVLV